MKVKEGGRRAGTHRSAGSASGMFAYLGGDFSGGAAEFVVLAVDFHLEDLVGV